MTVTAPSFRKETTCLVRLLTARYANAMRDLIVVILVTLLSPGLAVGGEGDLPAAVQRPQGTSSHALPDSNEASLSSRGAELRRTLDSAAPHLRACVAREMPREGLPAPGYVEVRVKLAVDGKVISSLVRVEGHELSPAARACTDQVLAQLTFSAGSEPIVVTYPLELPPTLQPVANTRPGWLGTSLLGGLCGPMRVEEP
ncbi:MAG: hypothetical protein ACO3JL_10745 [Myxococcota bacterium]